MPPTTRDPLVTIIVAAYGMPDYLNQAVESIANQTFTDYEIIVVDDCSGDEVTSRYILPPGARLLSTERRMGGPAGGRNIGIGASRSEFIAFLDQDDLWLPEKLAKQVALLQANPSAALVYCHYTRVNDDLDPVGDQFRYYTPGDDTLRQMIDFCFITSPTTILARRTALAEAGLFDHTVIGCEDWDLYMRMLLKHEFVGDPEPLALYRVHDQQTTANKLKMGWGHVHVLEKLMPLLARERPDLKPLLRRHLSHRLRQYADARLSSEGDVRGAAGALFKALRVTPWSWEIHRRLLATALAGIRGSGRRTRRRGLAALDD